MGLSTDKLNIAKIQRNKERVYLVYEIIDGCVGQAHETIAKSEQDAINYIDGIYNDKPDEWKAVDITDMAIDYQDNILPSFSGVADELMKLKKAACNRHEMECCCCIFNVYSDDYSNSTGCTILDLLCRLDALGLTQRHDSKK